MVLNVVRNYDVAYFLYYNFVNNINTHFHNSVCMLVSGLLQSCNLRKFVNLSINLTTAIVSKTLSTDYSRWKCVSELLCMTAASEQCSAYD